MKKVVLFLLSLILLSALVSCAQDDFNKEQEHRPNFNTSTSTNSSSNNEDISTDTANQSPDVSTDTEINTNTNTNTSTDTSVDTEILPKPFPDDALRDEKGLVYLLKDDSTLSVIGYEGAPGSFKIPEEFNGYTVTEIGEYAFYGYEEEAAAVQSNIGFVTISIPATVKKISKGAFKRCDDIKPQYYAGNSGLSRDAWLEQLTIEEENDHVRDVINFVRPAIGWNVYVKP